MDPDKVYSNLRSKRNTSDSCIFSVSLPILRHLGVRPVYETKHWFWNIRPNLPSEIPEDLSHEDLPKYLL